MLTGPMNLIVENLNKWAAKAEGLAGNVWGHCEYPNFSVIFGSLKVLWFLDSLSSWSCVHQSLLLVIALLRLCMQKSLQIICVLEALFCIL
jgi:hypothetical protein